MIDKFILGHRTHQERSDRGQDNSIMARALQADEPSLIPDILYGPLSFLSAESGVLLSTTRNGLNKTKQNKKQVGPGISIR